MKAINKITRLRVQTRLFRDPILVLQIGERYTVPRDDRFPPSLQGKEDITWRDATVEDLTDENT